MNKREFNFDSALIIAILSVYGYLIIFSYSHGYSKYYNMPSGFLISGYSIKDMTEAILFTVIALILEGYILKAIYNLYMNLEELIYKINIKIGDVILSINMQDKKFYTIQKFYTILNVATKPIEIILKFFKFILSSFLRDKFYSYVVIVGFIIAFTAYEVGSFRASDKKNYSIMEYQNETVVLLKILDNDLAIITPLNIKTETITATEFTFTSIKNIELTSYRFEDGLKVER